MMLPIGPFCPFVSESFINLEESVDVEHTQRMRSIVNRVDQLVQEEMLNPQEHLDLSRTMREADSKWRGNLLQMRSAEDFQTRELYQFTEAHLRHLGVSIAQVESFAIWQADVLESIGSHRPPPPSPADPASDKAWHLQSVLESVRLGSPRSISMIFDMSPQEGLSQVAESPVVQEELRKLETDHRALIAMGARYGAFDAAGKELFLDQIEMIGERWKVYLTRFQLTGEAESAPHYVGDASKLLERLGLTPALAQRLVSEAHHTLREEARRGACTTLGAH